MFIVNLIRTWVTLLWPASATRGGESFLPKGTRDKPERVELLARKREKDQTGFELTPYQS